MPPSGPDSQTPPPTGGAPDPRWYAGGLRFDCTMCGRCCTSNGEFTHLYLSQSDVLALAGELGLSEPAFRQQHTWQQDGWTLLRIDGPRCTFLEDKGTCGVYEARPMQCRTWPFWRENLAQEAWNGPVREICPGIGKGRLYDADAIDGIADDNERWYEEDL
ncbi:MAG: YkgJ family cysteine cluster protein [Planctomycetota bacterium]